MRVSDPCLPPGEEAAQVLGIHGLLDEEVDLAADAEHCSLLHTFEFLLQPQQHALRHLVEALTVAADTQKNTTTGPIKLITRKADTSRLGIDGRVCAVKLFGGDWFNLTKIKPLTEVSVFLEKQLSSRTLINHNTK